MRILLLSLLWLLPYALAAQQFKIGLSANVLHHNGRSRDDMRFASQKGYGYGGCISMAQSTKWIEVKYAFEIGRLSGEQVEVHSTFIAVQPGSQPYIVFNGSGYQTIAQPYYLPHVVANIKIPEYKLTPYAGILVGVAMTRGQGKMDINQYSWSAPVTFSSFKTYGVAAGLQAGASLPLSRYFELTGEVAWRRMWQSELLINFFGPANSVYYQLNIWQLNAGINFTLGTLE